MDKKKLPIVLILLALCLLLLSSGLVITGFVIKEPHNTQSSFTVLNSKNNNQNTEKLNVENINANENVIYHSSGGNSRSHGSVSGGASSGNSGGSDSSSGSEEINNISVNIKPGNNNIMLGEEFELNVDINSDAGIYAVDFKIYYDKNILEIENVTEGNFLKKDGASTYPVINVDNDKGEISFANTRFNTQKEVSGQGSLAIIKFKAIKDGESTINLENVTLVDSKLQKVEGVSESDGRVIVG